VADMPAFFLLILAAAAAVLAVIGLRGLLDIRDALQLAEFERLNAPMYWPATRGFLGLCAAAPVFFALSPMGAGALAGALLIAGLGYAVAPQFLAEVRQRAEQRLLDELALHLDLIALAMEAGASLTSALTACAERTPDGALRRCWSRVVLQIHSGVPAQEVLRDLEQRIGIRAFSTFIAALRSADRAGIDAAVILRERARQAAGARFARAERLARAAPLKLWATLMLCIAPCTLLVLAFPVAQLLALIAD
jgi:tight adherence protein C